MTKIGYARVSTTDQDTDIQNDRLLSAGCSIVRKEKVSGKSRDGRDELAGIMEFIRAGDELVVVKLDRLGRSTRAGSPYRDPTLEERIAYEEALIGIADRTKNKMYDVIMLEGWRASDQNGLIRIFK